MNLGDPKLKTPQNQPDLGTKTEIEMMNRLESFLRAKISKFLQQAEGQPDKKRFLIDQMAIWGERRLQERKGLFGEILAKVEAINYDNDAEFEKNVAGELKKVIVAYLKSHNISWEEALINFRTGDIEEGGDVLLDKKGVTYCSRYEDVAEVHITKGLTPPIWTEAFSSLLKIVQDDKNIKTIRMVSWFVAKKLSDFEKLGFTVNEVDEEEMAIIRAHLDESMKDKANVPWAKAEMTREEFLNSKILKRIGRV